MITTLHHKSPNAGENRILLIMLPGVGIEAAEFAENGMVAAAHAGSYDALADSHAGALADSHAGALAVDIIAVHAELELYLDGEIAPALHRAIVEPALVQGYARIWLLGISLGGMGALLYASAHAAQVEGLILLAPFLGTRGTIAEIAKKGGLAAWSPAGSIATDQEQRMLVWLRDFLLSPPPSPVLYLGYGEDDRFAPGHRLLAGLLPDTNVITAAGGHDWNTWLTLWRGILDTSPFKSICRHLDDA